jgi:carbonic anhydrase
MEASMAPRAAADEAASGQDPALTALRERLSARLGAAEAPRSGPLRTAIAPVAARTESAAGDGRNDPLRVVTRPSSEPPEPPPDLQLRPRAARVAAAGPGPRGAAAADRERHPAWGYDGPVGPAAWGGLRPEFSRCATGQRQSPIDIREGIAVDLEPITFDYRASPFRVIDNGHTVQVSLEPGNSIVVGDRRYELVQFHFHRPAEERIDGRTFEMSLHLVHRDTEGRTAVVGLLLDRGEPQPVVQTVWNHLPLEKHEENRTRTPLDLNHLLPADRGYYTYMGSLTTPPCDEGVLWMIMRQPVPVSQAQIDIFARLYPHNARPVQQAAGRLIKQSN